MDVEVRRDDLRRTRVVEGGDGNVRIVRFALSANNVTYGVHGDALSYWSFFPASEEGWGRIPVWGVGEVVDTGQLIYGYFPMSSHVRMQLDERLVERSPHRSELPATYNRYMPVDRAMPHLDEMLLLRPLFGTSILLADFLGAEQGTVVLGSASSKTAYGLAFLLEQRVVGLTSARNRGFVASLGVYDRVLTYDEVDGLADEEGPLVFVDMSGDRGVRERVRAAAGDRLRRDVAVGSTHWERLGGDDAAEFFFAPTHLERLMAQGGPALQRMGEAWDALMSRAGDWIEIERGSGPEDVERVWRALVDGEADPRRGHVLTLA
ncbi:MAG TPA: DUF2855 family protein [Solirubrobacteraceae bacterium]|nr:DUF2855 family protein [Solirubrobacteraceae bacterium]